MGYSPSDTELVMKFDLHLMVDLSVIFKQELLGVFIFSSHARLISSRYVFIAHQNFISDKRQLSHKIMSLYMQI
jgi:hypothetical protein